jgi:hypothetical protein
MARDKKPGKSPVAEEIRRWISINQGRKPIQLRYCDPRAAIYFKPACVIPGLRPTDFREARTMDSGFPRNDRNWPKVAFYLILTSIFYLGNRRSKSLNQRFYGCKSRSGGRLLYC